MSAVPKTQTTGGYEVARPQGRCVVSGRVIEPGEKVMAVLRETDQGFERLDISLECWEGFERANVVGFWQTTMPQPQQKKKLFVDDQVLCALFERLAEVSEPAKLNFRFMLGLILMRKRLLIYDTTRIEAEREIWQVRIKGRDEPLEMLDPKLDEQQMAEVSQQLGQVLNEEL